VLAAELNALYNVERWLRRVNPTGRRLRLGGGIHKTKAGSCRHYSLLAWKLCRWRACARNGVRRTRKGLEDSGKAPTPVLI